MALYTRTTWATGDVITATKLNNIEAFLVTVSDAINARSRSYRSGSTLAISGATEVVYNAEEYDTGSNHSTSTGRFTAPATGYYLITAGVGLTYSGSNGAGSLYVYKNGAPHSILCSAKLDPSTGIEAAMTGACIAYLVATDFVSIYVAAGTVTSPVVTASQADSYFAVSRIQ